MLTFAPGCAIIMTERERNPQKLKGEQNMSREHYEIHEAEYEAMMAFFAEEENLAAMDADYEESDGHLWD